MANNVNGTGVVGNDFAPEVFADDALGFENVNGAIRISLVSARSVEPIPPSPMQYVTIGRLVMPIGGAQRLAIALNDFLRTQGLDPSQAVKGSQPVQ